jgi:anti-sigma regulatory factor (Ser/Thr protein kinase)
MDSTARRPANLTVAFNHNHRSPSVARQAVKQLVADDDPLAWRVELVTSELIANVIQHTAHGGVVRAWGRLGGDPIRVEVSDSDPRLPEEPSASNGDRGYGLQVVDRLADAWGIDVNSRGDGKTIWAEFG